MKSNRKYINKNPNPTGGEFWYFISHEERKVLVHIQEGLKTIDTFSKGLA